MSDLTKAELATRLDEATNRIAELETDRLRAETLFAVTQVLGKTLSLQETIETILTELQRVVPYDSCSVQVIHGNRLVIVGARGLEDLGGLIGVGFDLEDETSLNGQVVRSKRPQVFGLSSMPMVRIPSPSSDRRSWPTRICISFRPLSATSSASVIRCCWRRWGSCRAERSRQQSPPPAASA